MNNKVIIKKYARALYNVAIQKADVRKVSNRINYIVRVIKAVPELYHALSTNQLSTKNKIIILENIFKDKISSLEIELLSDIMENNNIFILSEIGKYFEYLVETDSNSITMTISTASKLSDEEMAHIKTSVESQLNKKVDISTITDPKLIGGIKLRVGNTVIDNTISRRLNLLKNALT